MEKEKIRTAKISLRAHKYLSKIKYKRLGQGKKCTVVGLLDEALFERKVFEK